MIKLLTKSTGFAVLSFQLFSAASFAAVQPSFTQEELINKIYNGPTKYFGRSNAYKQWGVESEGALKALKAQPSLNDETKFALVSILKRQNSTAEIPFTTSKAYRPHFNELQWNGEWTFVMEPVAEVLAAHQVNEAVPVLVERYWLDEQIFAYQQADFYALSHFEDERAIPVYEDFLKKKLGSVDLNWNEISAKVIPTIVKARTSQDTEIADMANHLSQMIESNPNPTVQAAIKGETGRPDANRIAVTSVGRNGREEVVQLPVDKNFQARTEDGMAKTNSKVSEQGTQIAGLNDAQTALKSEVTANRKAADAALAILNKNILDQQAVVASLEEQLRTAHGDIDGIRTALAEAKTKLNNSITDLATKFDRNEQKLADMKSKAEDLQKRVDRAERMAQAVQNSQSEGTQAVVKEKNKN
ncbi:MAG: hypothetical protein J0L93_09355 [Deltaproteobacteria bacterium]|nr:hypothetical protein [Deltaproteobacteria bacterium]